METEGENEIEILWSNQADIREQTQAFGREEMLPGEAALLEIVRGKKVTKDPNRVCIHCLRTFATKENRNRHSERCLNGIITPNAGIV